MESETITLKEEDFLRPGVKQIRHQIRNIIDSYNHEWDILAELAQNSVDAIKIEQPVKGHMAVELNACSRTIVFRDNGCGINPDDLPGLLAPFSSDKTDQPALIGSKGVGITFVIFSADKFEIETHHKNGSARAEVTGGNSWVTSTNEDLPKLRMGRIAAAAECGTTITLQLPANTDFPIFKLTFRQIDYMLRTRTALGDTNKNWDRTPADKDFTLAFTDLNGETVREEIDCRYFLPIEKLGSAQAISMREFEDWNSADRTDAQKRQKLRDKIVFLDGIKDQAGRRIKYWACFVPKRKAWDSISVNAKLADPALLDLNPVERIEQVGDADHLFSGGMFTSTRGMPTGIRSEMRTKGSGGYLPNFFILLEDPQLSFDIGRKAIPGRQLGMLREIAADIFRDFINSIRKYISGDTDILDDDWERGRAFSEVRGLPDMNSSHTKFLKRPGSQEASVAAIFYELIGSQKLRDFIPYISGYKGRYDLYASYKSADVVIEFKQDLSGLFNDFENEAKLFDQIDIVVIWDVTEKDRVIVQTRGLDLQEVEQGLFQAEPSPFHYNLVLGPTRPIRILCIRRVLEY